MYVCTFDTISYVHYVFNGDKGSLFLPKPDMPLYLLLLCTVFCLLVLQQSKGISRQNYELFGYH